MSCLLNTTLSIYMLHFHCWNGNEYNVMRAAKCAENITASGQGGAYNGEVADLEGRRE